MAISQAVRLYGRSDVGNMANRIAWLSRISQMPEDKLFDHLKDLNVSPWLVEEVRKKLKEYKAGKPLWDQDDWTFNFLVPISRDRSVDSECRSAIFGNDCALWIGNISFVKGKIIALIPFEKETIENGMSCLRSPGDQKTWVSYDSDILDKI